MISGTEKHSGFLRVERDWLDDIVALLKMTACHDGSFVFRVQGKPRWQFIELAGFSAGAGFCLSFERNIKTPEAALFNIRA